MRLREFAPAGGGGGGDYFQALASAWYNGVFDTGSLPKGIKTQVDVERLLNRGIVAPDGKMRKYHIDYNSDFDGVEIYSDDYYEYGDHDDTIDSRTGQKWGPYDFMAFSDEDLSEGLTEVDRRGFLKGLGAAAVAGAAGYGADKVINDPSKRWKMDVHNYDALDKEYKGKSFSIPSNDKKMLLVVEPAKHEVTLIVNDGPDVLNSFSNLRMKIDNNPSESIDNIRGGIKYFSFTYPIDKILGANKILFQVAFLKSGETGRNPQQQDYRIITFVPGQQRESVSQGVAEGLNEFAADDGNDGGEDDVLRKYAQMWWSGNEATQLRIEKVLARMGWEIGEDEGGYDNGGVFVVRAGDENGKSYTSWPAEDLALDEGVWDTVKQIPKKANAWLDSPIKGMNSKHAGHAVQGAVSGMTHGHAVGHAMADTGVHEGSDDPFGPQGRFVGDTGPAQITATVPRRELRIGDRVLYKPTEQRARVVALSRDGSQARIDMPSPMGGRVFNCKTSDLKALGALEEKSTSQAQFRTMAAAAHDPKFAKKVGIKQSVAKEFNRADTGQNYKSLPKKAD